MTAISPFITSPSTTAPPVTSPATATKTDLVLLERVQRGDQDALMQLYQGYGNLVYSLSLRVLQNSVLAEEVTQDIFLKVWQHPGRWNPQLGQFSSWLLAITRNASIDRRRKEQRQPLEMESRSEDEREPSVNNKFSDDPLWYDGQILARLLAQLPNEQRKLVDLAFYQGYTHSELAELLHVPLGTIKTRLRMGLQKLREAWLLETG